MLYHRVLRLIICVLILCSLCHRSMDSQLGQLYEAAHREAWAYVRHCEEMMILTGPKRKRTTEKDEDDKDRDVKQKTDDKSKEVSDTPSTVVNFGFMGTPSEAFGAFSFGISPDDDDDADDDNTETVGIASDDVEVVADLGDKKSPVIPVDESQRLSDDVKRIQSRKVIKERIPKYADWTTNAAQGDMCDFIHDEAYKLFGKEVRYESEVWPITQYAWDPSPTIAHNNMTAKPRKMQWRAWLIDVVQQHLEDDGHNVLTYISKANTPDPLWTFTPLKTPKTQLDMNFYKLENTMKPYSDIFFVADRTKLSGVIPIVRMRAIFYRWAIEGKMPYHANSEPFYPFMICEWRSFRHICILIYNAVSQIVYGFDPSGFPSSEIMRELFKSFDRTIHPFEYEVNEVVLQDTKEDIHCQTWIWYFAYCMVKKKENMSDFVTRMKAKSPSCRTVILQTFRHLLQSSLNGVPTLDAVARLKVAEEAKDGKVDCVMPDIGDVLNKMKEMGTVQKTLTKPSSPLPPPNGPTAASGT